MKGKPQKLYRPVLKLFRSLPLKGTGCFSPQLHTFTKVNYYENMGGKLLHLNDGEIVSLGLTNISNVIVELEAWQVVIDILQDQVNCHERTGGCSFSLDH